MIWREAQSGTGTIRNVERRFGELHFTILSSNDAQPFSLSFGKQFSKQDIKLFENLYIGENVAYAFGYESEGNGSARRSRRHTLVSTMHGAIVSGREGFWMENEFRTYSNSIP